MLRLAVSGATGRMGQAILRLAATPTYAKQLKVGAILDCATPNYQSAAIHDISPHLEADCLKCVELKQAAGKVDLLIDFSRPEATLAYVEQARDLKLPLLIGTTGFSASQLEQLRDAGKKMPLLLSANTSRGMNLVMYYAGLLAKALGENFDIDIVETHHRHKADHPSGSAKGIGDSILLAKNLPSGTYAATEEGVRRRDGRPRYQSLRSGGVVGDHTAVFGSEFEQVRIEHRALNRDLFADGALQAALWLAAKPAGFYSMRDVLNIPNP